MSFGRRPPAPKNSVMDPARQAVLAEYERRSEQEWPVMKDLPSAAIASRIDEFLISIGPDTAKLLHLIITAARAQVLVQTKGDLESPIGSGVELSKKRAA